MVSSSSIAIFAPILFLLVLELSNIAQDTIELESIAKERRPPIQILGQDALPNLGRFFLIHFASMLLLAFTVFTALNFTNGVLQSGLLLGTSILLYFYPAFEVHEYDELLADGSIPYSFIIHLRYITAIIILAIFGPPLLSLSGATLVADFLNQLYLWGAFVVLPFLSARSFTIQLRNELIQNLSPDSIDSPVEGEDIDCTSEEVEEPN